MTKLIRKSTRPQSETQLQGHKIKNTHAKKKRKKKDLVHKDTNKSKNKTVVLQGKKKDLFRTDWLSTLLATGSSCFVVLAAGLAVLADVLLSW